MALTRVLITVKTYPTLSETHTELVCTAGFREDGTMIRIYPVPFRMLNEYQKYKKYQWISIDLKRRSRDFRPESYSPVDIDKGFELQEVIDNKHYDLRRSIVLKHVCYNMSELIKESKQEDNYKSLAVVKPKEILDSYWKSDAKEWDSGKLKKIKARSFQGSLFEEHTPIDFNLVRKVPYRFYYRFTTDDNIERNMMIEDWEVGVLYWNMMDTYHNEEMACQKVKDKFYHEFIKRDLYFYVGTALSNQLRAPNPFMIIGVFTPPKIDAVQMNLF